MFSIETEPQVLDHGRNVGEPRPEVIDHRGEPEPKRWSEKMRNEDITYKHLKQHRDALLESEINYKKTIKELEKEKAELFNLYEPTYNENKVLKSILQHGPDAVKMKKLQKAKKDLGEEVETLKDENKKLTDQMQEMIKKNTKARDFILEKSWKDVLANGKDKKDKYDTKNTQGPFPGKEVERNKNMTERENMTDDDAYDLQLDNVEKEIQILLNNVKHIKKQKEKLDYAILMGKGAIVRNSILENAIYEKLDEDLKAFKSNIDNAKRKHDDIKQNMEQKEKDVTTKIEEANESGEKHVFSEQIATTAQTKRYKTSETQTEFQAESKSAKLEKSPIQSKSDKKKFVKSHANRSVQTDFSNIENSRNVNKETINYLDQYQTKKDKLVEAKEMSSKKISSRKARTDYAKKLVARRGTSPNRSQSINHVPVQIKAESSQKKETKHDKQNSPVKRTQPVNFSYKDKFEERLPLLPEAENSNTRTNLLNSRLNSKSVDYLNNQQDISDYKDMIMVPGTDIIEFSRNRSKMQSRSNLDLSTTASASKYVSKKHKVPASLPAEDRRSTSPLLKEIQSWKSESDLHDYADNEINSGRPVKSFKFAGLRRNNKVYFRGEIDTEEIEKRDESAYNEVLADLNNQHKQSAQNVYQEFERTVRTFRESKDAVRKKQMRPSKNSNLLPSLDPQAPLRFTSDSRKVSGREIRQLLDKKRMKHT